MNSTMHNTALLSAFASKRNIPVDVFISAGMVETTAYSLERKIHAPAIKLATDYDGLCKFRFLDVDKEFTSHEGFKTHVSGLDEAIALAVKVNAPMVILANGEIAAAVARYYGLPAFCIAGGEGTLTDEQAQEIADTFKRERLPLSLLIPADEDSAGKKGAEKRTRALQGVGFQVHRVDFTGQRKGYDLENWITDNRSADNLPTMLQGLAKVAPADSTPEKPAQPATEVIYTSASVDGLLKHHLAQAQNEGRNNAGFKLASDLRDRDVPFEKAQEIMTQFVDNVDQNGDPYTEKEAMISLKSAYKYPKREIVIGKRGKVAQAIEALDHFGYTFRLNTLTDIVECNGVPLTDANEAHILRDLDGYGVDNADKIRVAMTSLANDNAYHPIQTYLSSLTWDGKDHIATVASHIEDKSDKGILALWLKRWLVGSVARAFTGEQNMMLVLEGVQGSGKSTFAKWLCSGMPQYFVADVVKPDNNDHIIRVMRTWVWEVKELGATTRKTDVEGLKGFITTEVCTARKPYGRYDIKKPALASFIGTVNSDGAGFLVDTTGNRRFMVAPIGEIDFNYTKVDINQLWAQAKALYDAGEPTQPTKEERLLQETINETYKSDDPVEDALFLHYTIDPKSTAFIASATIARTLEAFGAGSGKGLTMQISRVLTQKGLKKTTVDNVRGFVGLKIKKQGFGSY